jgi:predicted MFS family arabinose efflux permease
MLAAATMALVGPTAFASESIAIRRIVPPKQLAGALAQNDARSHIAYLLGRPVGGYLYGVAASAPILVDSVSFLCGAVLAAAVRTPLNLHTPLNATAPPRERASMRRQIATGLRHTWNTRFLRVTLLCSAGINVAFSGLTFAVIASHAHAGTGAGSLGLTLGIGSIGGLLGAWASPRLLRTFPPRTVIVGFGWIVAAALLGLGVVDTATAIGGLLAVMYFLAAPANGVLYAAQIHITPPHMQGRVVSAMLTIFGISAPLGPLLAGVLIAQSGQLLAFACLAALVAACTLTLQCSRAVRGMPKDLSRPANPPRNTRTTNDSAPQASSPAP